MEIFTYGSGEFIAGILEAVKSLTSGGVVLGMLKILLITTLLGGLVSATIGQLIGGAKGGMMSSALTGAVEMSPILLMIRNGLIAAVAVYFLMNPFIVTDVIVEDKYDPGQSKVVTSVPLGIAFIGHATSVVGDKMGEVIEELITPVEAVRFRTGGGVGIGPKYLNNLFDIMPPGAPAEYGSSGNVPTRGVVESWFSQCIYYQLGLIQGEGPRAEGLTAFASTEFLLTETRLHQPPFTDPNTPLRVQYYGNPAVNETTCNNATTQIIAAWYTPAVFNKWVERFSARLFGTKEDDATVLPRVYDLVDRYFPNSLLGSQDKLVQIAMLNAAYAAYVKFASENSDSGSADIARRRQGGSWIEMARVGTKSLFIMRQIAEACLYLFGAFLPVFMAATGFGALFKYVKFAFWLQLWIPIFAIFNAISDYNLLKVIESVSICNGGSCMLALNFETVDKLRTETAQILGYIGLMSMSAPGIAWGLMKGAESLGGMAGSVLSSQQAGSTGGQAATERTGALTSYTAGTMAGSAYQAGAGQMQSMSSMSGINSHGGLGSYGESVEVAMGKMMTADTWQNRGITGEATMMGEGMVSAGAAANFGDSTGRGLGRADATEFAAQAGLMPDGSRTADLSRMENRHASIISDDGISRVSFGESGGMPVAGFQKAALTYTGNDGKTKTLLGAEGQMLGDKFTVKGLDMESRQMVNLEGRAQDMDLANSRVNGYDVVSGRGESGADYRRTMSVGQALEEFKDLKGTKFYQGLSSMDQNKAVQITENRDSQTGRLANITATQGGKSVKTDNDERSRLTNIQTGSKQENWDVGMNYSKHGSDTWSGNRTIREDTNLNLSQHGTKAWSGFQSITENTNMKTGVFSYANPETGKTEMFQGTWHTDPKTGKEVAATFTNVRSGNVYGIKTDQDGTKHYGVGRYQSGPNGLAMVSDFRELSHDEIQKGQYAANRVRGNAGQVLHESAKAGQNVSNEHKFLMDMQKEWKGSAGDVLVRGGQDLTKLNNGQMLGIITVGAVNKGMEDLSSTIGLGRNLNKGTGIEVPNWAKIGKGGKGPEVSKGKTVEAKSPPVEGE